MAPLDVPGREGDFARLLEVCANAAGEPARGQIVFVAGDAGSGRSALLRALAAALRDADAIPIVLAGGRELGDHGAVTAATDGLAVLDATGQA